MKSAARVSLLAVTAVIGIALGGCSSSSSSAAPGTLPSASDGTNLQACSDGTCEVQVGPSAQIQLPSTYRVDSLQVQSIAPDTVVVTGHSNAANTGAPNCRRKCKSSSDNRSWQFTLNSSGEGTIDKLDVTLQGTDGKLAVLRITPNTRSK